MEFKKIYMVGNVGLATALGAAIVALEIQGRTVEFISADEEQIKEIELTQAVQAFNYVESLAFESPPVLPFCAREKLDWSEPIREYRDRYNRQPKHKRHTSGSKYF